LKSLEFLAWDRINVCQDIRWHFPRFLKFTCFADTDLSFINLEDELLKKVVDPLFLRRNFSKRDIFERISSLSQNDRSIILIPCRVFHRKDLKPSFFLELNQVKRSSCLIFVSSSLSKLSEICPKNRSELVVNPLVSFFRVEVFPSKINPENSIKSEIYIINDSTNTKYFIGESITKYCL
jgi:hypothetical protein